METFHIASDAAFLPFGEDQTAIWAETPGSSQPALEFDWNLDDPVGVSAVSLGSRIREITHLSPPQNIDWNPTTLFENPTHSDTAPASFEATNAVGFDPALTYPYSHPGDSNWMYPVSEQRLIVNGGVDLYPCVTGLPHTLAYAHRDALSVAFFLLP